MQEVASYARRKGIKQTRLERGGNRRRAASNGV